MGIQINGQTDNISAVDGSLTISGAELPNVTNLNATGIITATSFSGPLTGNVTGNLIGNVTGNLNSTGVSTVTDLRVGTAVTANSSGVQVGAGKSVRIYGSTSGYADLIAPAAAGDQQIFLPGTSGTLDRLNRVGNILQVVHGVLGTNYSNTSNTYTDTGLQATITPTSASNKILVMINHSMQVRREFPFNIYGYTNLLRNGVEIIDYGIVHGIKAQTSNDGDLVNLSSVPLNYLDSPGSTSALTYKTQSKCFPAAQVASVTIYANASTITLVEIAA
jgi:hypothetical protein